MSMFCYQCQETAKNEGCTVVGVWLPAFNFVALLLVLLVLYLYFRI